MNLARAYFSGCFFLVCLLFSLAVQANIEGGATQNFNPVYGGQDFVSVHSSSTVKKYHLNIGLFTDYSMETLPVYPTIINPDIDDTAVYTTLGLGFGLTKRWDVGISIPYILSQDVENTQLRGQFKDGGMVEMRFLSKFRFMDFAHGGGLAILGSMGMNQTKNLPFVGEDPSPTFNLQLAADRVINKWRLAGNIGYRFVSPGEQINGFSLFEPLGNTFISSLAASYQFNPHWAGIGEIWSSFPDADLGDVDREENSFEALLGAAYKRNFETDTMNVHFGVTKGLNNGISTPTARLYAGINYTFGPLFKLSNKASKLKKKKQVKPPKPVAKIDNDMSESFYNEGYRQGYMAGYGVGPYAGLGPEHGDTLDGGTDYPEGYYDAYLDASGDYPGSPNRPNWAKCYRTGFQGKVGNGPAAGKSADYGQKAKNMGEECPEAFRTGWLDAPDEETKSEAATKTSYYNPGYREGYKAGYGMGPYAGLGPEHGDTLDGGFEFSEGYYDGYMDVVGPFPGDPNRRTYGKGYRNGFQGKLGVGPGQGHNKDYGSVLSSKKDFPQGFEHGWIDAPEQIQSEPEVEISAEEVLPEETNKGYGSKMKTTTITENSSDDILENLIPEEEERINIENIKFNTDSASLRESSYAVLDNLLQYLNKHGFKTLEIWGHTDSRGASLYNERLSLERARSVYKYLVRAGGDGSKISFDGWGERKPVAPNTTAENMQKNRRVEFIIRR